MWKITRDEMGNYGIPQKRLHGHSHFVTDVVTSSDGHFALSGSWDKTLRLWDLTTGRTARRFEDHTKVGCCFCFWASFGFLHMMTFLLSEKNCDDAFSLRIWDWLQGLHQVICLLTSALSYVWCMRLNLPQDVLSVAFSADNRQIVSGSRDKTIKLWNTLAQCKFTIQVSTMLIFIFIQYFLKDWKHLVKYSLLSAGRWPHWLGVLCQIFAQ